MKCKNCNSEMQLDDKDTNKNRTTYWYICENCNTSCVKEKSGSFVIAVDWCEEDTN